MASQPDLPSAMALAYKGRGLIAEEIVKRAREAGVFVHESPEMVALLLQVDLDARIPTQLYVAIAELLAWIYRLEQGVRSAGQSRLRGIHELRVPPVWPHPLNFARRKRPHHDRIPNPARCRGTRQVRADGGRRLRSLPAQQSHRSQVLSASHLKSRDLITAYFNEGNDFLLTALLAVDDDGIVVDYGANADMNRRALNARKLILITSHDKVKIQFSVPWVKGVKHEGRQAFRAPLPGKLLRLQRREYYRLTAPVSHPLKCSLTLAQQDGARLTLEAQVVDISGGGIAVMTQPAGFDFAVDQDFEACQLELPDVGVIRSGLRVRNVFQVTLRSGIQVKRCGCQFMNLAGATMNLIERYIMKVERERKARGA